MPEDFNSTDVETEEVIDESGEQTEVVDQSESQDDPFRLVETDGDDQDGTVDHQDEPEGEPQVQSKEDNKAARAARLQAERNVQARIAEAVRKANEEADRRIAASGAVDPYTGKPFQNISDFEAYGNKVKDAELKERARKTGKTEEELRQEDEDAAYIRRKRQEESQAAAAREQEAKQKDFFIRDAKDFLEKYPEVNIVNLDNNPSFRKFCGTRYGKEPLADLYRDFTELVSNAGTAAVVKAESKRERSTGTGQTGGPTLTAEQRKSLDAWNSQNPDMKMTAKEFLSR